MKHEIAKTLETLAFGFTFGESLVLRQVHFAVDLPEANIAAGIVFRNFSGTTSKKYQPEIAAFACSSKSVCRDIHAEDINVKSPNGSRIAYCLNQDAQNLDVSCTGRYLGFN